MGPGRKTKTERPATALTVRQSSTRKPDAGRSLHYDDDDDDRCKPPAAARVVQGVDDRHGPRQGDEDRAPRHGARGAPVLDQEALNS